MRLAGCQRLSLGVESGSQRILDAIDKKITVDEIIESTELAKKYGIKVRYYMMLGNRGETRETFRRDARLPRARAAARVHLLVPVDLPGHARLRRRREGGLARPRVSTSRGDFQELKTPFDASDEDTALHERVVLRRTAACATHCARRRRRVPRPSSSGSATTTRRTWTSAARSTARARSTRPSTHVRRALELGYPLPGLALQPPRVHREGARRPRRDDGPLHDRGEDRPAALRADPERATRRARGSRPAGRAKGLPLELDGAARLPAPRAHRAADAAGAARREVRRVGRHRRSSRRPSAKGAARGSPTGAS